MKRFTPVILLLMLAHLGACKSRIKTNQLSTSKSGVAACEGAGLALNELPRNPDSLTCDVRLKTVPGQRTIDFENSSTVIPHNLMTLVVLPEADGSFPDKIKYSCEADSGYHLCEDGTKECLKSKSGTIALNEMPGSSDLFSTLNMSGMVRCKVWCGVDLSTNSSRDFKQAPSEPFAVQEKNSNALVHQLFNNKKQSIRDSAALVPVFRRAALPYYSFLQTELDSGVRVSLQEEQQIKSTLASVKGHPSFLGEVFMQYPDAYGLATRLKEAQPAGAALTDGTATGCATATDETTTADGTSTGGSTTSTTTTTTTTTAAGTTTDTTATADTTTAEAAATAVAAAAAEKEAEEKAAADAAAAEALRPASYECRKFFELTEEADLIQEIPAGNVCSAMRHAANTPTHRVYDREKNELIPSCSALVSECGIQAHEQCVHVLGGDLLPHMGQQCIAVNSARQLGGAELPAALAPDYKTRKDADGLFPLSTSCAVLQTRCGQEQRVCAALEKGSDLTDFNSADLTIIDSSETVEWHKDINTTISEFKRHPESITVIGKHIATDCQIWAKIDHGDGGEWNPRAERARDFIEGVADAATDTAEFFDRYTDWTIKGDGSTLDTLKIVGLSIVGAAVIFSVARKFGYWNTQRKALNDFLYNIDKQPGFFRMGTEKGEFKARLEGHKEMHGVTSNFKAKNVLIQKKIGGKWATAEFQGDKYIFREADPRTGVPIPDGKIFKEAEIKVELPEWKGDLKSTDLQARGLDINPFNIHGIGDVAKMTAGIAFAAAAGFAVYSILDKDELGLTSTGNALAENFNKTSGNVQQLLAHFSAETACWEEEMGRHIKGDKLLFGSSCFSDRTTCNKDKEMLACKARQFAMLSNIPTN